MIIVKNFFCHCRNIRPVERYRRSSASSFNMFSQTDGPIRTKPGRNVHWKFLFKNCSQNLIPSKTLVAMATKWIFFSNSIKIFSLNRGSDFEIISQECSLGDPFKNYVQNFDPSINMALVNGGFFALYGHEEILKKSSSPKLLIRF